jgi:hypothetical protein
MNLFRNIKKNYVVITFLTIIILVSIIQYTKLFSIIEGTSKKSSGDKALEIFIEILKWLVIIPLFIVLILIIFLVLSFIMKIVFR